MKFQIISLLLLLTFSCHQKEITQKEEEPTMEELQFKTALLKLHETPLHESTVDKLRIIISLPYGGKMYASTIMKYDNLWMYSKTLKEQNNTGHIYNEQLRIVKDEESQDLWTIFLAKFNELNVENIKNQYRLSDNAYALLEIKEDDHIIEKEVILCETTSWIKEIMEEIADEKLDFFVPKCEN